MNFRDIVMVAATQGSGGASAPPAELFPDPTLIDVTDSVDGWQYSNGFPSFGPKGGTGPGIQAAVAFDDDVAQLIGADDSAFLANLVEDASYSVGITFANVTVGGDLNCVIGAGGSGGAFAVANGTVVRTIEAGPLSPGSGWFMQNATIGATYDITHISVVAV